MDSKLTQITSITKNTIADGDSLNLIVTALNNNDHILANETISANTIAEEVYDLVSNNSATNWDHSDIKNFATVGVNNSTIRGSSNLSSTLKFESTDTVSIEKNEDFYKFTTSKEIQSVSSYFNYAAWDNKFAIGSWLDAFAFESTWFSVTNGSMALYEKMRIWY